MEIREIIGNTTATPNPRPDWNQTDETKADYIKNKPAAIYLYDFVFGEADGPDDVIEMKDISNLEGRKVQKDDIIIDAAGTIAFVTTVHDDYADYEIKMSTAGKSAYKYAVDSGYTGTESKFGTELSYLNGLTGNIQNQLSGKASDFTIELYNGSDGNPKPIKFASFDYSTCNSENGIAAKISMVSGHGNGSSYAFLQDAIIRVGYAGSVSVDNYKYYGVDTSTYDGAVRQYGDIFWVIDETNKIVDFYCLMGQYARVNMTPWKRLTFSSKGSVTQYTTATAYSSGGKFWANNSDIALMSDIESALSTIPTTDVSGQISTHNSDTTAHSDIRGSISNHETRIAALESAALAVLSGTAEPTSEMGEDGAIYLLTV